MTIYLSVNDPGTRAHSQWGVAPVNVCGVVKLVDYSQSSLRLFPVNAHYTTTITSQQKIKAHRWTNHCLLNNNTEITSEYGELSAYEYQLASKIDF